MAPLPSPGPPDERASEPDSATDAAARGDAPRGPAAAGAPEHEQPPTPALWAAALALLALLAFGVLIGSLSGGAGSGEPQRVVLAAAPSHAIAQAASSPAGESGGSSHSVHAEGGAGAAGSAGEGSRQSGEEGSEEGAEGGQEHSGEGSGESGEEGAEGGHEHSGEGSGQSGEGGSEGGAGAQARSQAGSGKAHSPGPAKRSRQSSPGRQTAAAGQTPPIKHVFLIVLADQGFEEGFGASAKAPSLAKHLRAQGALLDNSYAATSGERANEIALVSGQGPTTQTAADCPVYEQLLPGKIGPEGQVLGNGCVYPKRALTIGDQLTAAGKTWKAYVQGVGPSGACALPSLGAADPHAAPTPASPYVTWRDPFAYFRSITSSPSCAKHLVSLGALAGDLKSASHTPSLSYIAPDPCDDGSPEPCAPGRPAGMTAAEPLLRKTVSEIGASLAYREGGLIAITFDQAPQSGPHADSSGCCITVPYPNLAAEAPTPASGTTGPTTSTTASAGAGAGRPGGGRPGGGRVGLLLISKYVKPGSVEVVGNYDHFSLLLSIESIFELRHPLGYAGAPGLLELGSSVYNRQP